MLNIFWPYATRNSVSDQLWFLRKLCYENDIPVTVSHQLDPISHNIAIENLNEESAGYIERFCSRYEQCISVLVTEFLSPGGGAGELYVNGELLHRDREYNPELRSRFENLRRISKFIYSFISLGGQPDPKSYCDIYGVRRAIDFEIPNIGVSLQPVQPKEFDLYFSGSLTRYRKQVLCDLEQAGLCLLVEGRFVSENNRKSQLRRCSFNLNIPQSPSWRWLSTMRVLFGLRQGVLAAQPTNKPDFPLSDFVLAFSDRRSLWESFERDGDALGKRLQGQLLLGDKKGNFKSFVEEVNERW